MVAGAAVSSAGERVLFTAVVRLIVAVVETRGALGDLAGERGAFGSSIRQVAGLAAGATVIWIGVQCDLTLIHQIRVAVCASARAIEGTQSITTPEGKLALLGRAVSLLLARLPVPATFALSTAVDVGLGAIFDVIAAAWGLTATRFADAALTIGSGNALHLGVAGAAALAPTVDIRFAAIFVTIDATRSAAGPLGAFAHGAVRVSEALSTERALLTDAPAAVDVSLSRVLLAVEAGALRLLRRWLGSAVAKGSAAT